MKNEHVWENGSALSFEREALNDANTQSAGDKKQRHAATMPDQYRAMLLERYNAPYTSAYRHWGINE
jgi:hypothetical protein